MHLAAKKQVGESVEQPLRYYRENVHGLTVLLEAVVAAGVRRFVFSSSAAVYGVPDVDLVTEDTPCVPMNPYGETKLAGEWLVRATGQAHGMATACLRYFNVAGAAAPELADTGVFNIIPMFFDAPHPRRGSADLRGRLSDAGRHLRPGLHPRRRIWPRPISRPPAGSMPAAAQAGRRAAT